MKKVLGSICLLSALLAPSLVEAREVTFAAEVKSSAYLAMYLVDADGRYQRTLWVAGRKRKYYRDLRGWARASRLRRDEYDGLTGASITRGRALQVSLDLDDQLIDAGNRIVIDTATEHRGSHRAEIVVPFTTENSGQAVHGQGMVSFFSYHL